MFSSYEEESYGYKVDLEVFSGPLDLLLYLIQQEEVEITDIPIARITDQYLAHLELMQQINVNVAGEFLVMAATLMEIKSRMLLPRPEAPEEEPEDPRSDLIRQLIEYKKFKDAARELAARADEQALKFTRGAAAHLGLPEREPEEDLPILLGEVTIWQLQAAFRAILSQTTLETTRHIVIDERPASAYCNDLLDELRTRGTATFRELFDPAAGRAALINAFLALLELIRRRRVRAEQASHGGEIRIVLLDDTPVSEAEITAHEGPPAAAEIAAPAASVGQDEGAGRSGAGSTGEDSAGPPPATPAHATPPAVEAEGSGILPAEPPVPSPAARPFARRAAPLGREELAELDDLLGLPDIEAIPEPSVDFTGQDPKALAAWRARRAQEAAQAAARPGRRRARARAARGAALKPYPALALWREYGLKLARRTSLLARLARCRPAGPGRGPVGVVRRRRLGRSP